MDIQTYVNKKIETIMKWLNFMFLAVTLTLHEEDDFYTIKHKVQVDLSSDLPEITMEVQKINQLKETILSGTLEKKLEESYILLEYKVNERILEECRNSFYIFTLRYIYKDKVKVKQYYLVKNLKTMCFEQLNYKDCLEFIKWDFITFLIEVKDRLFLIDEMLNQAKTYFRTDIDGIIYFKGIELNLGPEIVRYMLIFVNLLKEVNYQPTDAFLNDFCNKVLMIHPSSSEKYYYPPFRKPKSLLNPLYGKNKEQLCRVLTDLKNIILKMEDRERKSTVFGSEQTKNQFKFERC